MISIGVEEQVRQLVAAGRLSQRAIARRTGVSRATVAAIASGRRAPFLAKRLVDDQPYFSSARLPERCCKCGVRVYMPCHACYVRGYRGKQERWQTTPLDGRRTATTS